MTRQDANMDFENRASQQHQWPSQFRAIPTAGDVLASRPTARADTYDISIVPDAAHVTARRYPEAMEKVRELARASGVDGWFTSDHTHYTRVATHRARDGAADDSQPSAAATTATHMECPMEQPIEFLIRAGQADTVDQLREYAVHRLSLSLRRFERRIRHITVRIADVNGPRRGVDSRCSMSVDLVDGKHVFVNAISAWPFAAVSQAASRLSKVLRRKGDRGRAHRDNSAHLTDREIASRGSLHENTSSR